MVAKFAGVGLSVAVASLMVGTPLAYAQGEATYVENVRNAEDLVAVPGGRWVIASGGASSKSGLSGQLYLVGVDGGDVATLYPHSATDDPGFGDDQCGKPDWEKFNPLGIDLRAGDDGQHILYAVNHGGRRSIEIFRVDFSKSTPGAVWAGCVVMPEHANPNDVVALPDGGIAITVFHDLRNTNVVEDLEAGTSTGYVLEWQKDQGFMKVPGSELSGNNGLAIDKAGNNYFLAAWGSKEVIRLPRNAGEPQSVRIATDILSDNLSWSDDGKLLLAGEAVSIRESLGCFFSDEEVCASPYKVLAIDPATMQAEVLIDGSETAHFGGVTVAVHVGSELWLGAYRHNRLARFGYQP